MQSYCQRAAGKDHRRRSTFTLSSSVSWSVSQQDIDFFLKNGKSFACPYLHLTSTHWRNHKVLFNPYFWFLSPRQLTTGRLTRLIFFKCIARYLVAVRIKSRWSLAFGFMVSPRFLILNFSSFSLQLSSKSNIYITIWSERGAQTWK